jgi:uncharacterized lipoprotein YddW (UPF0748 family)
VAHDRELRGAWISTVYNGTWPSRAGLTPAAAQSELLAIFDGLAAARMNVVFLQVRAESDALYASSLEPWSRFLTGTQGEAPGWDPLAFAVAEGHARGLEIHAWINPYRGLTSSQIAIAPSHVTKRLPDRAVAWGNQVWMDPGAPELRAHLREVVRDIVTRYDVDGLHFDDYFYPYPIAGTAFPDDPTYGAYQTGGGKLGRLDWRRSNVDTLVREISELVRAERPDVRFGISPFGIYRPGTPEGIVGLDAYDVLACDPVRWIDEGWVDYLVPQLYWPTTRTAQSFEKLIEWWAGLAEGGRSIFVGHDLTKIGGEEWPLAEYERQMDLSRARRTEGVRGNVFFTSKAIVNDQLGVATLLSSTYWKHPVATPRMASATGTAPAPVLSSMGTKVLASHDEELRALALYREGPSGYALERLVRPTASSTSLDLLSGRWAVSAIDRQGRESGGVVVDVE